MSRRSTRPGGTSRPTIADVARACGLSKGTVSKALNIPPERCPVRPDTRERVLQAAKDLGYRPSWLARALAKQKTHTVGLLYARLMPPVAGIYERLMVVLAATLQHHGYHLVLVSMADSDDEAAQIVLDQRMDGCIVLEEVTPAIEQVLIEAGLPTVLVNLQADLPYPSVMPDDQGGGRIVTEHLLGLGHRRITFFDPDGGRDYHFSHSQRQAGYAEAMRQAGLEHHIHQVTGQAAVLAEELARARDRSTAVVAYSHLDGIELLQALWRVGLRVPQDVSVATFNDVPSAALTIPPLTTVSLPTRAMGQEAGERLIQQIESDDPLFQDQPQTLVLPETLVVRESTAPPA